MDRGRVDDWSSARTIFRTTDGGAHWTNLGPAVERIAGALFVDEKTAWVATNDKRSPDTVRLWAMLPSTGRWTSFELPIKHLYDVTFVAARGRTYALAKRRDPGSSAVLWVTNDRGETWTELPVPERPTLCTFLDDRNGFVVAGFYNDVFETHDGGATWTATRLPSRESLRFTYDPIFAPPFGGAGPLIGSIAFEISARGVYAPGVLTSLDEGHTWTPHMSPWNYDDHPVVYARGGEVWAFDAWIPFSGPRRPDRLHHSHDGGATWTRTDVSAPPIPRYPNARNPTLTFASETVGWLKLDERNPDDTETSYVLLTINGGKSFRGVSAPPTKPAAK